MLGLGLREQIISKLSRYGNGPLAGWLAKVGLMAGMRRRLTMIAVVYGKGEPVEIEDLMRVFGRMNGSSCNELEMQICDERKGFEGEESRTC